MRQQDYFDVSQARDLPALEKALVAFANEMDFGLISAVMMVGNLSSPNAIARSVSNTPQAFLEIAKNMDQTKADPVMQRLMDLSIPFVYDQRLYVDAGAADIWETQAPFGYCTGIAVALHMPGDCHFLLGIDRPKKIPRSEIMLTRMLADLQLLAVHAQDSTTRLLGPELRKPIYRPKMSAREIECLKWTMEGKSAWAIGQITSLSVSAVNYHLQTAMRKLEVSRKDLNCKRRDAGDVWRRIKQSKVAEVDARFPDMQGHACFSAAAWNPPQDVLTAMENARSAATADDLKTKKTRPRS
ncbi:helix-turn-helix transcriptional regulator [Paucibacter soli]|uniref:helix-turn-helix transcriptional regulator n=1 Tax=Paucibacter soli TaxID=3133433 RepID=UPI0030A4C1A6